MVWWSWNGWTFTLQLSGFRYRNCKYSDGLLRWWNRNCAPFFHGAWRWILFWKPIMLFSAERNEKALDKEREGGGDVLCPKWKTNIFCNGWNRAVTRILISFKQPVWHCWLTYFKFLDLTSIALPCFIQTIVSEFFDIILIMLHYIVKACFNIDSITYLALDPLSNYWRIPFREIRAPVPFAVCHPRRFLHYCASIPLQLSPNTVRIQWKTVKNSILKSPVQLYSVLSPSISCRRAENVFPSLWTQAQA